MSEPDESTRTATTDGEVGDTALPAAGEIVDRYRIVGELGAGGMGVVYRALDLDLERHVALKVLHGGAARRERLLDEARAMAKLRHPNVVAVYDVGTAGARDFIAMELVEGRTLGAWQRGRRWRAIVAAYVAAARGLAAAHRAGIVHRDFKPGNVLVGDDGRIAVGDFGIALEDVDGGDGRIAGTPRYMAPEQRAGAPVDARADQYSVCVALREALEGARPPRRVARAIARGLAEDPAARHRDLSALIGELEGALARRRRSTIAAATVVGASALAIAWVATRPVADDGCEDGRLAEMWRARRGAVDAALAGRPNVQRTVLADLDAHAARWQAAWDGACRAGPRDRRYHERAGCLLASQEQAAHVIAQLAGGAPPDAAAAIEALPDPTMCERVAGSGGAGDGDHEGVRAVDATLARLRGEPWSEDAIARARAAVDDARAIDPALTARALLVLGELQLRYPDVPAARAALTDAVVAAEEAGADVTRAQALVALAELEVRYSADVEEVRRAVRRAAAAVERAPADPRLRGALEASRGALAMRAGHARAAIVHFDAAATLHAARGARIEAAQARGRQISVMAAHGLGRGAVALGEQQLATLEAAFGGAHPETLDMLERLIDALQRAGRTEEAHARVADLLTRTGPRREVGGAHVFAGVVVDAAGVPVAGATVDVFPDGVHMPGDALRTRQATDAADTADLGIQVVTTDADGRFTAPLGTARALVIAEGPPGRSTPRRVDAGADLRLELAPWAFLAGRVTGRLPDDLHVHVAPVGEPEWRLEVPIVDGAWRARVPAGAHVVQLVRIDEVNVHALVARTVEIAGGATKTVDLELGGTVAVSISVDGERGVPITSAGVLLIPGAIDPLPSRGADVFAAWAAARAGAYATATATRHTAERANVAHIADVVPGTYTLCAVAVAGDLWDPIVRTRMVANVDEHDGACRVVTIAAEPAQELRITVPPPRAAP